MTKQERNVPCACGSGKKYKKCHYLIDHETARKATIERNAALVAVRQREKELRTRRLNTVGLVGMVAAVMPSPK